MSAERGDGLSVVNATPGSRLDVFFPRVALTDELARLDVDSAVMKGGIDGAEGRSSIRVERRGNPFAQEEVVFFSATAVRRWGLARVAISFLSLKVHAPSFPSASSAVFVLWFAGSAVALEPTPPPISDSLAGEPVRHLEQARALMDLRKDNAPRVGDQAPDFQLTDAVTGQIVSLGELRREKPVVLYFASYSCSTVQQGAVEMARLSERFASAVEFVLIYIQEAHPSGGLAPPIHGESWVVPAQRTYLERMAMAVRLAKEKGYRMRVLTDTMDDALAVRWGAWPVRIFVVGTDGKVLYAGGQGPWYHWPSKEYSHFLDDLPEQYRDRPGYSRETLEEFLARLRERGPAG